MSVQSGHKKEEDLLSNIAEAAHLVKVGGTYSHYRSPDVHYRVIGLVIIEATEEVGVAYNKASSSDPLSSVVWIRPISSWTEKVSHNNTQVPRFQKVAE